MSDPNRLPELIYSTVDINGELVETFRPQDSVVSFTTSRGSVYTYDENGHTTRFKTVTGEEYPKQDITVFVDAGVRDVGAVAASYLLRSSTEGTKIQVAEQQPDGQTKIVIDIKDVQYPDNIVLATFKDGQILKSKPASLSPAVGKYVFDTRHFDDNGTLKTERHLGHKVTSIRYKEQSKE